MTSGEKDTALLFGWLGLLFGWIIAGFVFIVVLEPWSWDYPGLEDRINEERADCESGEGVVDCKWDANKAKFVPKENND